MSAAFTPGPWEVAGHFVRTARRPDDMSGIGICECLLTNPNRDADARLIANAPKLLAHLQFAVDLFSAFPMLSGAAQIEGMRSAISAATGEQP